MKQIFTLFISSLLATTPLTLSAQWSLSGNSTTGNEWLGTTNYSPLLFKTNNIERANFGANGGFNIGSPGTPNSLNIYGKDVNGSSSPVYINSDVLGMTWGYQVGRTQGKMIRLNQGPNNLNGGANFYDIGIGKDTCLYFSNHGQPGYGVLRKRMIVISPEDRVGINLDTDAEMTGGGDKPTANFHTRGTVRHQDLPSGSGMAVVIDAQGNLYRASGYDSALQRAEALQTEVDTLRKQLADLKAVVDKLSAGLVGVVASDDPLLQQNAPNPFTATTVIKYVLKEEHKKAAIVITDHRGQVVKTYDITGRQGIGSLTVEGDNLVQGLYFYTLIIDGRKVDSKKMQLTR